MDMKMEKPNYISQKVFDLIADNLNDNDDVDFIITQPANFLKNRLNIFDNPELLEKVIFSFEDDEYMFSSQSIEDIKSGKDIIEIVSISYGGVDHVNLSDIKESFENNCMVDFMEEKGK